MVLPLPATQPGWEGLSLMSADPRPSGVNIGLSKQSLVQVSCASGCLRIATSWITCVSAIFQWVARRQVMRNVNLISLRQVFTKSEGVGQFTRQSLKSTTHLEMYLRKVRDEAH